MNKWLKLGRRESSSLKWLISIELLELENGRFGTIKIVFSHKNPLQLPQLWSKVWWGVGYLHSLETVPNNVFTYYKEKSSNFKVENLGRYSLTKWSKLVSLVIEPITSCSFSCDAVRSTQHYFVTFLQKMHSLNLNMRDHQTNLNWGTLYKINGLCSLKISVLQDTG